MTSQTQITIDAINVQMPDGFEKRAESIMRRAISLLSNMQVPSSITLGQLSISPVRIQGAESNETIARAVANAIHTQIHAVHTKG
jgi:hypothetical protein